MSAVNTNRARRFELLLPMRTVLLVAVAVGVIAAFREIGDTFLLVFVGIFLALVFEYPVRFVMAKTRMSRGLAATVTVIGTGLAVTFFLLLLLFTIFQFLFILGTWRSFGRNGRLFVTSLAFCKIKVFGIDCPLK